MTALPSPPAWMQDGLCSQVDPDLYFEYRADSKEARQARNVCTDCPVRQECLDYGLYEPHGIWGGLTEKQRQRLRNGKAA